jgi:hypothetical protein
VPEEREVVRGTRGEGDSTELPAGQPRAPRSFSRHAFEVLGRFEPRAKAYAERFVLAATATGATGLVPIRTSISIDRLMPLTLIYMSLRSSGVRCHGAHCGGRRQGRGCVRRLP